MPGNPYNAQGMQNALRANPNANFMQNRAQGAPLGALPGMSTTPTGWNTVNTPALGAGGPNVMQAPMPQPMPYPGDVTQNPQLAGLMEMERRRRMAALMRQRQAAMQGGGMPPQMGSGMMPPQMGGAMRPPMPSQAAAGLANRPPMPAQGMGVPAGRPVPPAGLSNIPPRY